MFDNEKNNFICYSGGAIGADTVFEEYCMRYGVTIIAWSFDGHSTKSINRKILTKEELHIGWSNIIKANKKLKRNISNLSPYVKNLLSRNWYQVKDSDAIFAVANLSNNKDFVEGGTGWACMLGVDNFKPVYVFDSNYNSWFKYNYDDKKYLIYDKIPILPKRFAGIGTREIDGAGVNAISDIFLENIKKSNQVIGNERR